MTYFFDLNFYENIDEWVMDYHGLADPFEMNIQIGITNTYSNTLWFKAELVSPPAEYTEYVKELGSIDAGLSDYKAYTFKRALPGAKVTDALTLKVTAYKDAGYTEELTNDTLAVSFYLFDHDSLTLVDHNTFDTEGDFEGWEASGHHVYGCHCLVQESTYYINAPYSIRGKAVGSLGYSSYVSGAYKVFTIGSVSEAFLVYHYYKLSNSGVKPLEIDGKSVIPSAVLLEYPTGTWFRFAIKLPTNKDVTVNIGMYAYAPSGSTEYTNQIMDDVWIITSP